MNELDAYWLGFIAADGCITTGGRVQVDLADRDASHLVALREYIGAGRFYHYPKRAATRLVASNRALREWLAGYGVVPRKSATLPWPHLDPEAQRHFLRGLFDGDGGIYGRSRRRGPHTWVDWSWQLTGNERLVLDLRDWLDTGRIVRHARSPGYATLVLDGPTRVEAMCHLLYDDATVWLGRKHDVAERLFARVDRRPAANRARAR